MDFEEFRERLMLPFFLFAMYEKNGQPLEVVLNHKLKAEPLVLDESAPDEFVNSVLALKKIKSSNETSGRHFIFGCLLVAKRLYAESSYGP